ncbi:hypothetical protein GTZ99_08100 [Novosphingobium sp. FSY-8]|uniref:Uncharacterized protein n=1 Tax=Novosphingobium ovatum TaxID=1908523 RepID=A0ABW9XD92_9SPHN|nr:hypothetical protein [Novosphingobium ovatum]NBC36516.1 hypothetical protein [Novosphingobium ovatum]
MNRETIDYARRMMHVFQVLNRQLGSTIAGSRTWDVLLFLKSEVCGQTAQCISQSLGYPLITTARWLNVLHEEGVVSASINAHGQQQFHLTPKAHQALDRALHTLCEAPLAA